ncbi:hypothetical protein AAG906_029167 [Vitis piasezkii]
MIKALEGILQSNSEAVLIIAAKVALKLVRDFPSSVVQSHVLHLIQPFSSLLSSHQLKVASRCENGLYHILSHLSLKEYGVIWEIWKETNACWQPSRYRVWNDAELLRVLEVIRVNSDSSVKVAVLQLYSALALCGNGAERLLENGKNFIKMVVQCMDSTQPPSVRIEAFKLSQLLTRLLKTRFSVAVEAGRLALITRWAGEHHIYFWKLGIGKVLIEPRLSEFLKAQQPQDILLSEEQKSIALKDPTFTWDILGGLVTLWGDFNPKKSGNDICFLIDYAWDVALQAEATKAMQWTCKFCSVLVPHVHVHKVILCSSSGYFRAMFQSGMQECHSRFIKVPVSWEALVKLVDWLYSDKLPTLVTGCLWDNMDERKKLRELQLYLELCLLADYLLLEDDIQEHCSRNSRWLLGSPCGSCPGIAVNCLAPSYSHPRLTGEIEKLDEELVDMVHAASVRHSQGSTKCKLEE